MINQEWLDAVAKMTEEGLGAAQIAARLGIHASTVRRYRRRSGVAGFRKSVDPVQVERVARMTVEGMSSLDIASELNICERTVERHRKRAGVTRPTTEPYSNEELETMLRLLEDGCSYAEVARTVGRQATGIRYRFPGYSYTRAQTSEITAVNREFRKLLERRIA